MLQARGADGILAIDTQLTTSLPLPTVLVSAHSSLPDVTNVVLDHDHAARLALRHLYDLRHRKIVYLKGHALSIDAERYWSATMKVARNLGLVMEEHLTIQLSRDSASPEISYTAISQLLESNRKFTAIVCLNDSSAIGSMRALHGHGYQVPRDVSIVGFDDIQSASCRVPGLTTIRQPLKRMGRTAAEALLQKMAHQEMPATIRVEPQLMVRESSAAARRSLRKSSLLQKRETAVGLRRL